MRKGLILLAVLGMIGARSHAQGRYDVVISEIFADPSPPVGLPNYEWIEIKNVSPQAVNLQGWRLMSSGSMSGPFPLYHLQPDSQLIVCSSSALSSLLTFGPAVAVTSFPSLNNSGELIWLRSSSGISVHAVPYALSWFKNELKQSGGWSLEMIDPTRPCIEYENWTASRASAGGTPGRINSVYGQIQVDQPPTVLHSHASDSVTILVLFDRPVDSLSATRLSNYSIDDNIIPLRVSCVAPHFSRVELKLASPLQKGKTYQITTRGIHDCSGISFPESTVRTGLAADPAPGELLINEILFNPPTGGVDFIEILNVSDKVFDLSKVYLANRGSTGLPSSIITSSAEPRLIFPGDHIAITENREILKTYLPQADNESVFSMQPLPSYPDQKGTALLMDMHGNILDELPYNASWHYALLPDPEGVSLERINPAGKTADAQNWHSAASDAGYATPGRKNSQWLRPAAARGRVQLSSKIFSPDHDGRDDVLLIMYDWESPGYTANITIYETGGRPVRRLVQSAFCGTSGQWKWDGLNDKGMNLPASIYILHIEVFNLEGRKSVFREAVVLARR